MGIYQNIYQLIVTYVYGGAVTAGSPEELVATLISTCAVVFMVALPFMVVKKVLDLIGG